MPTDLTLLQPGDALRTWGELVRDEEGDWFQPPLPVPLMYPRLVERHWGGAVPVVGADFESLVHRRTTGPRIGGYARLAGLWTGDAVEVQVQSSEPGPRPSWPAYRHPPGQPPEGGWPTGTRRDLRCDYGGLRRSGVIVASTHFRPSRSQAVLVVAANDLQATEAQLRPQLGDRLCVVLSRCSRAELRRAKRELTACWPAWSVYVTIADPDDQGQPLIRVSLSRLLPEVLDWVATTPPGLVELRPWLAPAREVDRRPAPAPAPAPAVAEA